LTAIYAANVVMALSEPDPHDVSGVFTTSPPSRS
jgi:hypothetical protein